jgi:hypothetical protein
MESTADESGLVCALLSMHKRLRKARNTIFFRQILEDRLNKSSSRQTGFESSSVSKKRKTLTFFMKIRANTHSL